MVFSQNYLSLVIYINTTAITLGSPAWQPLYPMLLPWQLPPSRGDPRCGSLTLRSHQSLKDVIVHGRLRSMSAMHSRYKIVTIAIHTYDYNAIYISVHSLSNWFWNYIDMIYPIYWLWFVIDCDGVYSNIGYSWGKLNFICKTDYKSDFIFDVCTFSSKGDNV